MALNAYGGTSGENEGIIQAPPPMIQTPQQNPYGQEPQAQAPQSGPFDSVPFHSWLAQNAKANYKTDPWNLTDDQINKSIEDYANGPLKTILGHQIDQTHKSASDATRNTILNNELAYNKMLASQQIAQSLPQIREHFQSLRPANAPTQTQQTPEPQSALETLGRGVASLPSALTSFGAMALGGVGKAADYMVNPILAGAGVTPIANAAQPLTDQAFSAADAAAAKAKEIRGTPGDDFTSKAAATVGSLPEGIATMGMSQSIENARNAIQQGEDLNKVKKNLAIDAATNLLASRLPGGNVLARAAKGAVYNPILQTASAYLKGDKAPDATDTLLSSIFGAGFGAALGPRAKVGETANAKLTVGENQTPANQAEVNALAAQAGASDGGNASSTAKPANATPLSEATQNKLNNAFERIADAPKNKETPQQVFAELSKDVPPEQLPAFTEAFNQDWESAHGARPIEAKSSETQLTASTDTSGEDALATAAKETPVTSEAVQPNLGELVKEPITIQVRGEKGRATNQRVPVEFQNDTDRLAYLYKNGDEAIRPVIAEELVKRGVPTEQIQEYANKVDKDVSTSANTLKHKVILSDRGFTKPELQPLKRATSPKAKSR